MEALKAAEIANAVDGTLLEGDPDALATGVSIDTRTLRVGDLFFALKGERSDGHNYLAAALKAGAAGIVVSDEKAAPSTCGAAVIKVRDTLWALGDLARYYRNKFNVRVIGITGSVGKTTTKEMVASILSRKWRVLKNRMNFNNEIGVPLTLFQLNRRHKVVVLEMAMRGIGEIRRLASIARPEIGVITNIGISHIERLGSQGAIADAKAELLDELPASGLAVLNAEDGYYSVLSGRFAGRAISFGSCDGADIVGSRLEVSKLGRYRFEISVEGNGSTEVRIPAPGHHNVYNALAAAATAIGMGVDLATVRDGVENFTPPAMRMELVESKAGYTILNDSYNANPASTDSALKTLCALKGFKRKIAVLGDMLELGDMSAKAHHDIGAALADGSVQLVVTVGEMGKVVAAGAREAGLPESAVQSYSNSVEAGEKLKTQISAGDAVLVKGSRGMKMEEIVRVLLHD